MNFSNGVDNNEVFKSLSPSNNTENLTYVDYSERIETYAAPTIFAIIFLVGLIGNGTLVTIFIRNRVMRNVPNTYIISLATGDLLVITITVPFISTIYIFENWPYGPFVCKLSEFLKDMSVGVTVFTLTALSAERYTAIVKPVRIHISGGKSKDTVMVAVSIWILAILLATPSAYFSNVKTFHMTVMNTMSSNGTFYSNNTISSNYTVFTESTVADNITLSSNSGVSGDRGISVCYPFPEGLDWYPKVSVMTRFIIFYALPLIFISVFYIMMAKHLYVSSKKTIGETSSVVMINGKRTPVGQTKQMLERKKVANIVLTFVLIFAVCFLPNHIYMIWFYFNPNSMTDYNGFWHAFKIIGYLLAFINSCINPIALYCLSAAFRKYFNQYIFCCCTNQPTREDRDSLFMRKSKNHLHSTMTNTSAVTYL